MKLRYSSLLITTLCVMMALSLASCDEGGSSSSSSTSNTQRSADDPEESSEETTQSFSQTSQAFPTRPSSTTPSSTNTAPATPVNDFDGVYNIAFKPQQSVESTSDERSRISKSELDIIDGIGTLAVSMESGGSAVTLLGVIQTLSGGEIDASMRVEINGVKVSDVATDNLVVQGNTIRGTYTYQIGSQDRVNGFINGVLKETTRFTETVHQFDGLYSILVKPDLESEATSRVCVSINNGEIAQTIELRERGDFFSVFGSVQESGHVFIFSTDDSAQPLVTEGTINSEGKLVAQYETTESRDGFMLGSLEETCSKEFFEVEEENDDNNDDGNDDSNVNDQPHLLCAVKVDISGDGVITTGKNILDTITSKDRVRCTTSDQCGFLFERTLDLFDTGTQCWAECRRLALEDPVYEPGCIDDDAP